MATFWEIAARSVSNLFSLYLVYLQYLFVSGFGFKCGICPLIAPFPVHCFSITFFCALFFFPFFLIFVVFQKLFVVNGLSIIQIFESDIFRITLQRMSLIYLFVVLYKVDCSSFFV